MAVAIDAQPAERHFSVSKIISRFRTKARSSKTSQSHHEQNVRRPDGRLPLNDAPLPLVLPHHQDTLPSLGWTTITFPQPQDAHQDSCRKDVVSDHELTPLGIHPLQKAYEELFTASQTFFNLPDQEKGNWKHKLGTEEGWSKVPGEKEFITLRSLEYCPDVLKLPAQRYWNLMGAHLSSSLGRISASLGLPDGEDGPLKRFVGPCATMQANDAQKTATMLRLFRYESWDPKVVAEAHADLGLLSAVIGNVPGLEVWDGFGWFEVEKEVEQAGQRGASMLVGRQLERFSNGRYAAGGHRVVSYGLGKVSTSSLTQIAPTETATEAEVTTSGTEPISSKEKKHRFSIVFVLRAHEPVVINSDELESEITGKWKIPLRNTTAGQMYDEIKSRHFNINIGKEQREKQRQNVGRLKYGGKQ